MRTDAWFRKAMLLMGVAAAYFTLGSTARAEDWGRYYHWPYSAYGQYYWTPNEYQQVYDGRYRYPAHQRWLPQTGHYRNWLAVRKRYYRGYHFILDQF